MQSVLADFFRVEDPFWIGSKINKTKRAEKEAEMQKLKSPRIISFIGCMNKRVHFKHSNFICHPKTMMTRTIILQNLIHSSIKRIRSRGTRVFDLLSNVILLYCTVILRHYRIRCRILVKKIREKRKNFPHITF